jgi:CelD/BcsL family acetyltransferase involved in cellulose biosynthesis
MGDGSGDSDNLDLIARPGREEACIQALLHDLQSRSELWDVCEFHTLPPDSPAARELIRALKRLGWALFTDSTPGYVVALPETWEAYLQQISPSMQRHLRKDVRRLERNHQTRYHQCAEESEIDARLEDLFRLHQTRWKQLGESGAFASEARRRFYAEISRLFLARGWLEFWWMDVDGPTAAAEFQFRYRDTVYDLQGGFDPTFWGSSVGYALRAHVLGQCIRTGVRGYDFLGGTQPYKARWGGQLRNYVNLQFARPRSYGGIYLRAIHGAARGKEWMRSHLPRRVGDILRRLRPGSVRKPDAGPEEDRAVD